MFANTERQEVDLVVGESTYVLKLTIEAAIGLETKLKKSTGEILASMATFSISTMAEVTHWLLQEHHAAEFPNNPAGRKKVAQLMDRCKSKVLTQAIMDALGLKEEADDTGNPQQARVEIGERSTLKLAESA